MTKSITLKIKNLKISKWKTERLREHREFLEIRLKYTQEIDFK